MLLLQKRLPFHLIYRGEKSIAMKSCVSVTQMIRQYIIKDLDEKNICLATLIAFPLVQMQNQHFKQWMPVKTAIWHFNILLVKRQTNTKTCIQTQKRKCFSISLQRHRPLQIFPLFLLSLMGHHLGCSLWSEGVETQGTDIMEHFFNVSLMLHTSVGLQCV